jgi:hypothetical protein
MMGRLAGLLLAIAAASAAACFVDPVHDDEVSALGPETPGVPRGPLHRPGQPCLVCHGGSGPASHQFSVAGTAFALKDQNQPLPTAIVSLADENDASVDLEANAAGNFFVTPGEYEPYWPVHVQLALGNISATMNSHIGRDGSCADCHYEPPGPQTPGYVYLFVSQSDFPDGGIP